ncbi:arylamine N-acetyltransferase [Rothia terrae]|nr:arylamine N-acetyltransferase [Rothia terrae]
MFRLTSKLHNTSSWYTEDFDIPAYLRALSVEPAPASYELLAQLHRAHVETFPFTNVDVVLEMHPGINPSTAQDQLMNKNRGGYCFEHAQIFAAAAEYLGFEVRRHLGRVKSLNLSRTHMSVVVTVDGTDYLCDPGFGFSIYEPVELRDGATGVSVGQTFTLEQGWMVPRRPGRLLVRARSSILLIWLLSVQRMRVPVTSCCRLTRRPSLRTI